ncbi:MAG: hypothetical protein ACLQD8_08865 [Thermoplasmata archaeon]
MAFPLLAAGLFLLGTVLVLPAVSPRSTDSPPISTSHFLPSAGPARTITLNRTSGDSFLLLYVDLMNFVPSGRVTVNVYNASVPSFAIESDPFFYLNSSGGVYQLFTPNFKASVGTYTFTANESGAPNVSATYTIHPSALGGGVLTVTASPDTGYLGSSMTITELGFLAGQPFNVYLGAPTVHYVEIGSGITGAPAGIIIPSLPTGFYVLFIQDDYFEYAATTVIITAAPSTIALSPPQGTPGTVVTATMTGFTPPVEVTFDSAQACITPTLTCTFVVPSTTPGPHTVAATDFGTNFASTPFTVLATPAIQYPAYFLDFKFPVGEGITTFPTPYNVAGHHVFLLNNWTYSDPSAAGSLQATLNYSADAGNLLLAAALGAHVHTANLYGMNDTGGTIHIFLRVTFSNSVLRAALARGPAGVNIVSIRLIPSTVGFNSQPVGPASIPPLSYPKYLLTTNPGSNMNGNVIVGAFEGSLVSDYTLQFTTTHAWLNVTCAWNTANQAMLKGAFTGAHILWLNLREFDSSSSVVLNIGETYVLISAISERAGGGDLPTFVVSFEAPDFSVTTPGSTISVNL